MIFLDRSLPRSVANALKLVRDDILWLEDRFPHDTKDVVWLAEAGRNGWMVISRDKRIRYRPGELRAIRDAGVGCFVLNASGNMPREAILQLLVANLSAMEQAFRVTPRPFIYTLGRHGRLTLIRLPSEHGEKQPTPAEE